VFSLSLSFVLTLTHTLKYSIHVQLQNSSAIYLSSHLPIYLPILFAHQCEYGLHQSLIRHKHEKRNLSASLHIGANVLFIMHNTQAQAHIGVK